MSKDEQVNSENDCFRRKLVAEFLDGKHHFRIPSFQRGYRWGRKEVMDLLEDLRAFVLNPHQQDYYLQPVVVKKIGVWKKSDGTDCPEGAWDVLDGQQRLTTLRLLIKNLIPYASQRLGERIRASLYDLNYLSRPGLVQYKI